MGIVEKIKPVSAKIRLQATPPLLLMHTGLAPEGVGVIAVVPKVTVDGAVIDRFTVVEPVNVIGFVAHPVPESVTVALLVL